LFSSWFSVAGVVAVPVEVVLAAVVDLAEGAFTLLEQLVAMVKQKAQMQDCKINFFMALIFSKV
jgi:hypothetical protein